MPLGIVSGLWRYPVKSMLGESCAHLDVDARGVRGDRRFAVRGVRKESALFGFSTAATEIVFPDGRRMDALDPAIHEALSRALGRPVSLVGEAGSPHVDSASLHLITTASLRWLQAALPDSVIDERRFRPNLVIEAPGERPLEQGWLGRTLCVGGGVKLRVVEPTERCAMTTFAQAELPADPRVLAQIARGAQLRFGVYAEILNAGTIVRGDAVYPGDPNGTDA